MRRCKVLSYCGRSCAWSRRPIRSPFPWATRTAFSNLSAPWKTRRAKRRRGCSNICSSFSTWATEVGAISQNLIVGGKSADGRDLTNLTSYALLDAYYEMNLPQPILSVKVHGGTPDELYREMGKFFFTPGCLTPSVFNDDSLFPVLKSRGADEEDLENYAVAGCQEPLISGKDNGNTTNSWLNLAKSSN